MIASCTSHIQANSSLDRFSRKGGSDFLIKALQLNETMREIFDQLNETNSNSPQCFFIVAQLLESFMQHCNLLK